MTRTHMRNQDKLGAWARDPNMFKGDAAHLTRETWRFFCDEARMTEASSRWETIPEPARLKDVDSSESLEFPPF